MINIDEIPVSVTGWKLSDELAGMLLLSDTQYNSPALLPFVKDGRYYQGVMSVPAAGTVVIEYSCPRPLRLWIGGMLVLDECLYRFSFQREMNGVVLFPCKAEMLEFRVEVGPRPVHHEFVDASCPSRNRNDVLMRLAEQFPDRLMCKARVSAGAVCPASSLRFLPTQFAENGTVYQHVLARQADCSMDEPPSIDLWSVADRKQAELALTLNNSSVTVPQDATLQEVKAGLKRFFVPVGRVDEPDAPLRTVQTDNRVEPKLEPVRTIVIHVDGEGGGVKLDMPVYERLGRGAPVREYSPTEIPSFDDAKKMLPEPILPDGLAKFGELYDEAWRMLFRLVRHPQKESGIQQPYISTGSNFSHSQFVWDTSFTAMCTAYGSRALPAYATINLLYSAQHDGGYIHRETDTRDGMPILFEPDFSPNPPIISVAEWAMACITGDRERLRAVYPLLVGYHEWLRHHRRLPDGTYWTTGLANGLDNSPSIGDGYPCLTAQMAHDAEILGRIAAATGAEDDAARWSKEYAETVQILNDRLWDEGAGFYSTSLPGGGHNPNKVVTGFWPLWAGAVPESRVVLLADHVMDPKCFWRTHPIPSLAADSVHFVPAGQYWLGSTWAPTNYAAIKGFERCGRRDIALDITLRHLDCMWRVYKDTGFIWENYCSEELKRGSMSMQDYCWSALGPIALLIEVVLGIQADAMNNRILWNLPEETGVGIRNMPLGSGIISLLKTEQANRSVIRVESDREFDLHIRNRGNLKEYKVKPGLNVFE